MIFVVAVVVVVVVIVAGGRVGGCRTGVNVSEGARVAAVVLGWVCLLRFWLVPVSSVSSAARIH